MNIINENKNGKKEKILPVSFPPLIVNYLHYAQFLTIILSNDKHLNWFYANFIHVTYNSKVNQNFNFYMQNQFDCDSSFFLDVYRLHNQIIDINKIDIINNIINWINNDSYVKIYLDSKLIPDNAMQKSEVDYLLPVFIYGYNLKKRIFYTQNFNANRNYSIIEVAFHDIEKAFYSEKTKKIINTTKFINMREQARDYFINLYKLNNKISDCYDFKFYLKKIKNSMITYLKGEDVLSVNNEIIKLNDDSNYKAKDYYWGINTYDGIAKKILLQYNIYHGLFEHKKVMSMRLNYLHSKKYFKTDEFIIKYKEVVNIGNMIRLLCIKTMSKNIKPQNVKVATNKMIEYLKDMKIKEKDILSNVIENIVLTEK